MEHSTPQFDTSDPRAKRVGFYIGLVLVFLAVILIITLLFFGGAATYHKKTKELSPAAYDLRALREYEERQLKNIDKAMEKVVRDYQNNR